MIGIKHRLKIAIGQCYDDDCKIASHRRASSNLLASLTLQQGIKCSSQPTLLESHGHNSQEGASHTSSVGIKSRGSRERSSSNRIRSLIKKLEQVKETSVRHQTSVSRSVSQKGEKSLSKPALKLASTLKEGMLKTQPSKQLNLFSRTTSLGNMGDILKSSVAIRKKVGEKLKKDNQRNQARTLNYQKHRRMLSAIDKNSTEFESYFKTAMQEEGSKTSRQRFYATQDDKENQSLAANLNQANKKSKSKEIQRKFTKSLLKEAMGKFGGLKTQNESQRLNTDQGADGPTKMIEFPEYLKDMGMNFESLKETSQSQPYLMDLADLFSLKKIEDRQEKPAFTFNNDQCSKKNSMITFKDEFSNDKKLRLVGSSAGRPQADCRGLDRRYSEGKENGERTPEARQEFTRHPKSKMPLIASLNEDITDLSALDSRLNWPVCKNGGYPSRAGEQSSRFNKPSIPSGLGSFIEGKLDDSNAGERNLKIFESTESLLIKIHKEFSKDHEERDAGLPDTPPAGLEIKFKSFENLTNSRFISPPNIREVRGFKKIDSDSVNIQSGKTVRRQVDSFVFSEQEVCRNFQYPPTSKNFEKDAEIKSNNRWLKSDLPGALFLDRPELKEIENSEPVETDSRIALPQKNQAKFKKSHRKRLQEFAEVDIVSSCLPRVKLEAPDLTRIESADYHRAVSIDDRDLKSLLCLKSIDFGRRASKDLQDNLLLIDNRFEKDSSMINDTSVRKPPKCGSKSQRTFVQDERADTSMSPGVVKKKCQGDKLYKSGSNIPLERLDDSDNMIPQSDKILEKKLNHFPKTFLPVNQEVPESSIDLYPASQEIYQLTVATKQLPSIRLSFTNTGASIFIKSSKASKSQTTQSQSTAAVRKHVKSASDTYYLSSECTSLVKTKSSHRLFSGLQMSENPGCPKDHTRGESKESDYSFHNLNSSSGLHKPFIRNLHGPEFCPGMEIEKGLKPGAEPQSDKVKVFKRDEPERGSKTMRFNFFSCNTSVHTSERKQCTSDINKFVQEIKDIRKIPEVDESKFSIDQRTRKISPSSRDQLLLPMFQMPKPLKLSQPILISSLCYFLPSSSQLDFIKSEPNKYKSLARSSRSCRRSQSRQHTERCLSSRSTKRVSFEADLKSSSRSRLDSARDAYRLDGNNTRVPKLALDKLKMVACPKVSSSRQHEIPEVLSQAANTQNTSELFANILDSYLDTEGNLEYSAKENEYFTKVINSGYHSSRIHSKSNPSLVGSQFRASLKTSSRQSEGLLNEVALLDNIEALYSMFK